MAYSQDSKWNVLMWMGCEELAMLLAPFSVASVCEKIPLHLMSLATCLDSAATPNVEGKWQLCFATKERLRYIHINTKFIRLFL